MQPIFTMQYGEWVVANELSKKLSKSGDKVSIFVPISAQEKGIDLIVYQGKSKTIKTIQVKMSRTYEPDRKRISRINKFNNYLWFNSFKVQKNADWYVLVGIYCKRNVNNKKNKWETICLALKKDEMKKFNKKLTLKKSNKPDTKFGFGFNDEKNIYLTRGRKKIENFSNFLLEHRLLEIREELM